MNHEEKIKVTKLWVILLFIFNILMPMFFMLTVEISMDFKDNSILTNGFYTATPIKIYHLALYGMLIVSIFSSAYLFLNLNKIYT